MVQDPAASKALGVEAGARLQPRTARALDTLNFTLADVRDGLGPYLAIYLISAHGWDAAGAGLALSISGIAALLAQTPAGALVDAQTAKRTLVGIAAAIVTLVCLVIPLAPDLWPVAISQAAAGVAEAIFPPAILAITLGIVGSAGLARRTGRNEAFNHAGNAFAAAAAGGLALHFGPIAVFWLLGAMALGSIAAVFSIPAGAIDHAAARGLEDGQAAERGGPSGWRTILACRPLVIFAVCVALFHLANAAMLPLVGQKLAQSVDANRGTALMSACIIAAQLVMVVMAWLAGQRANTWGRKPLFLAGFLILPLRGVLYTLSDNPFWLVGVQLLDGVGAGLFGVLFPLIVADLTRGTGRTNASLGAVATAKGVGASVSNAIAGVIVVAGGYSAAFLFLAMVAAAGAALFWLAMPETMVAEPRVESGDGRAAAAVAD